MTNGNRIGRFFVSFHFSCLRFSMKALNIECTDICYRWTTIFNNTNGYLRSILMPVKNVCFICFFCNFAYLNNHGISFFNLNVFKIT